MKTSYKTIFWILIIFSSAFYARKIYTEFVTVIGKETLRMGIWFVFVLLAGLIAKSAIRLPIRNIIYLLTIICSSALLISLLDITEERFHILKYGILGFLLCDDHKKNGASKLPITPIVAGIGISALDEGVQWILPYRVGDLRDILIDGLSVIGGVLVRHFGKTI